MNLKAFDSRFFRICSRRLESVVIERASRVIEVQREGELALLGLVPEVALDGLSQVREAELLVLHRNRAGLDLRQIQDVADQGQQVRARRMNGRAYSTWRLLRLPSLFSDSCWPG